MNNILDKAKEDGLRYITDQDARPQGSAHVLAHLWDNGTSISKELDEMLSIRKVAIKNFSVDNIQEGTPYSVLEDVFVPLYFFHRYQTEGVAKVIGGLEYNYAVKGDGQEVVAVADVSIQQEALKSVLRTLDAAEIAIPKEKLSLFPPRSFGTPRTRESIKGKTGVSFDALSAVETASDMTLKFLLHPEKASRLIQQKAIDTDNVGLADVLDELIASTINKKQKDTYLNEAQTIINFRVLYHIMNLAGHTNVHPQVNAIASQKINELNMQLMKDSGANAISAEMVKRIKSYREHPEQFKMIPSPKIPDGSPIGMSCFH